MTNHCRKCGKVLEGWQKNRSFCDWDCYQAWRYPRKYEIKVLQRRIASLEERNETLNDGYGRLYNRTHCKAWLLKRLLGLV